MTKVLTNFDALADLYDLPRPETAQGMIDNLMVLVNRLVLHTQTEASGESMCTWEQYDREYMSIYNAIEAHAQELARPSTPTAVEHKPLFAELIAQHPGLREEIAAEQHYEEQPDGTMLPDGPEPDERAEFEAWVNTQPIKPFPMHMAAKAFAAGFAARASKGTR